MANMDRTIFLFNSSLFFVIYRLFYHRCKGIFIKFFAIVWAASGTSLWTPQKDKFSRVCFKAVKLTDLRGEGWSSEIFAFFCLAETAKFQRLKGVGNDNLIGSR